LTTSLPPLGRRHVLAGLTGPLLLGRGAVVRAAPQQPGSAAPVAAVPFPEGVTVLVAGPEGGRLGRWGEVVGAALGQSLPPGTKVKMVCAGGADGVTGANQFDARVPPDGSTVLLTPGAAALDWLVGDSRAHFDVGCWVPVMAGVAPAIVMVRPEVLPLTAERVVRIAAAGPVGPQLPALLGFDLLGVRLAPVFGLTEQDAALAAFAAGKADTVLAWGQNVPQQVAKLREAGGKALFGLGTTGAGDTLGRDPAFAEVATLGELYASLRGTSPSGPRYHAYRAAAAATQLEFGLVLPQLTTAAMVALWRRAAAQAASEPGVQALASTVAVRPLEGVAAAAAANVAADSAALLDLRGWLATHFHWQPG
jgi:hypothetical protein